MSSNDQYHNNLLNNSNQNLDDPVVSNSIYWNNQNDENEAFATLFANTLLHDDFAKETQFDCLGLDNLQLSYNTITNIEQTPATSSAASDSSSIQFIQLTDLKSLNINDNTNKSLPDNLNNNDNNIFNEYEIIKLDNHEENNSGNILSEGEKICEQVSNLNEQVSLVNDHTNKEFFESNFLIKQLTDLTTTDDQTISQNLFVSPTQKSLEDDRVFKKPLSDHVYINNYNFSNLRKNSNESNDLFSKIVTNPQPSIHQIQLHKNKLKDLKTNAPKTQKFALNEKNNKKEKSSNVVSTSGVSGTFLNDSSLFSSLSTNNGSTFTSSMNKLLSLKRSRKRSKLLSSGTGMSNSSLSSSMTIQQLSGNQNKATNILENNDDNLKASQCKKLSIIKQNKFNLNSSNIPLLNKSNNKKAEKKAEKLKLQLKKSNSLNTTSNNSNSKFNNSEFIINSIPLNFEPLTKKLAVSSINPETSLKLILTKNNNKDTNNNNKKDEVDLDIKELSLLDLHSSEDDSNEMFLKNKKILNQLKKNTRSSSNDNVYLLLNNSSNEKNNLNELLSKRIKYSPAVGSSSSSLTTQKEETYKQKSTSHINQADSLNKNGKIKNRETISNDLHKESKINKFIQYLTKSLDSDSNSSDNNSSSESLGNKIQKQESISISSLSSFNSNSSCSILNSSNFNFKSQNKRKKKDSSTKKFDQQQATSSQQQLQQTQPLVDSENNEFPITITTDGASHVSTSTSKSAKDNQLETAPHNLNNVNLLKTNTSLKNLNQDSIIQLNLLSKSFNLENDTVQHMQNLDINNDLNLKKKEKTKIELDVGGANSSSENCAIESLTIKKNSQSDLKDISTTENLALKQEDSSDINFKLNLNDPNSRKCMWNLLKTHSTVEELIDQFGSSLHNKISFWDLVQLKLKFSKKNMLKTTYEIIDDYTLLYSNMSSLLEKIVDEHSSSTSSNKKNENSSRSRSSSRNYRKLSTSFSK